MSQQLRVLKPTVITDAMFISSVVPETDHAVYNPVTTYAAGNKVIYNHRRWESSAGSNQGHAPGTLGETWWIDLGPTNQWSIFDYKNSTATVHTTSGGSTTWWTRVKPGICTGVYVSGIVNAKEVKVQMYNGATLVKEIIATLDNTIIRDAWEYWNADFDVLTDILIGPLPPYYGAEILVTLVPNTVGDTVKCGGVQFGPVVNMGKVTSDLSVDFRDFSIKEVDGYKEWTIVERDFSNLPKYVTFVELADFRRVYSTAAAIRATPCCWIVSDDYRMTPFNAFGFPRSFRLVMKGRRGAYFSLGIEGM